MFGIPDWALGVGFIIVAVSIAKALGGRLGPPNPFGGPRRSRRDLAQAVEDLQKRVGGSAVEDLQKRVGGSDDVQTRLDALEDVQRRLADVEERLDFAERMLAKQRDVERIVPPKH